MDIAAIADGDGARAVTSFSDTGTIIIIDGAVISIGGTGAIARG